jgi:alkylation response protein AidB-like acyl-CoA dehydrogenase
VDFDFSEEQAMLRRMARELLVQRCTPRDVRAQADDPFGFSRELWQQLAEVGLLGISVPEEFGGQGLGLVEQAIALDELGRAACPGPYLPTVLASSAIVAGGDRGQMASYLPKLASGELTASVAVTEEAVSWTPGGVGLRGQPRGGEYVLNGRKLFVPWAQSVDLLVVAARTRETDDPMRGITLFAIPRDTPGVTITPNEGFDLTSRTATVELQEVRLGREAIVGRPDEGWPILSAVLERAAVGAAAEMLGASRRCMEMSVEYAKVREQFGQPIGAFQAVKHACAEMLVEVENSHAAVYYAAWALDAGAADARQAASVAKAYVNEAARKVCGSSIQVHGGIGFTWEYDLHLFFKHAKHLEAMYGDADFHRTRVLEASLQPVGVEVPA